MGKWNMPAEHYSKEVIFNSGELSLPERIIF